MNVKSVLIDNSLTRSLFSSVLVLFGISALGFTGTRLYRTVEMEQELAGQAQLLRDLRSDLDALQVAQNKRIETVEAFTFGHLTSEVIEQQKRMQRHVPKNLDAWILRRDAILQERISKLERWRLLHDYDDAKGGKVWP